jgi:hypothetical protein
MEVISQLAVGEALVSTLEPKGVPSMVERTLIRPPSSRIGPVTDAERAKIMATSDLGTKYDQTVDRISAYEQLGAVAAETPETGDGAVTPVGEAGGLDLGSILGSVLGTNRRRGERLTATQRVAREVTRTVTNRVAGQILADIGKSIGTTVAGEAGGKMGSSIGRAISRGTLGGILRGG